MEITITPAQPEDAEEILAVQKLAFERQAQLYNDYNIPPLRETVEEVRAQFGHKLILKAVCDDRIVGSLRAYEEDAVVHIGRVSVHPEMQRHGIATSMMNAVEASFPLARVFHLFTGSRSEANIRLYGKLGYEIVAAEAADGHPRLVHMEKRREVAETA